jgi:hypothetical protein
LDHLGSGGLILRFGDLGYKVFISKEAASKDQNHDARELPDRIDFHEDFRAWDVLIIIRSQTWGLESNLGMPLRDAFKEFKSQVDKSKAGGQEFGKDFKIKMRNIIKTKLRNGLGQVEKNRKKRENSG